MKIFWICYIIHIILILVVGYLLSKSINKKATLWQKTLCVIFLIIMPMKYWRNKKF